MPTTIGTYSISVDSTVQGWTPGCVVRRGESLRVQADHTSVVIAPTPPAAYSFPEGTYPDPELRTPTHAYEPLRVIDYADWGGGSPPATSYIFSNLKPFILGMVATKDGVSPPTNNITNGFQPNIDTTYTYDQLAVAAGISDGSDIRTAFCFNDFIGAFGDNSGSFSLTLTRTTGDPMSYELESLKRPQIAIEPSYGTNTTATRQWVNIENGGFMMEPDTTVEESGLSGDAFTNRQDITTDRSKGSLKGILDFRDINYWLASIYGAPTHTNLASGVEQQTYSDSRNKAITPQSYTFEAAGSSGFTRPYKANGVVIPGLKIGSEAGKQHTLSANLLGKRLQPNISPSAGQNGVQILTVTGSPTTGTFIVQDTDTGVKTTITWTATYAASAMQTAIRLLGGDWASATVSASAGGPYTITSPTGKFLKLLTPIYTDANGASTFGDGTTPTVTIAYSQAGGMKIHASDRANPTIFIGFADTLAGLDNSLYNPAPTGFKEDITIGDRFDHAYKFNPTSVEPSMIVQKKAADIKDMVDFTAQWDAAMDAIVAAAQALTGQYVYGRIKWVGSQIASSGYYLTLQFDFACRPVWKGNPDSQGNIRSGQFEMNVIMDANGFRGRWISISDIADYTAN